MAIILTQADIDGSERLHGGHSGGRDLAYTRHYETRRTAGGVVFERVTHRRKPGASGGEPIPADYTRIISDAELEAEYAPFREAVRRENPAAAAGRVYGTCPPRYCGFCERAACKYYQKKGG